MSRRVSVDGMTDAIMEELEKYADLAADDLKAAVKDTTASVRKDIQAGAPADTGKYKKSWSVKNVHEDAKKALILWCIQGTVISWHISWSTGAPSAAAVVWLEGRISLLRNRRAMKSS